MKKALYLQGLSGPATPLAGNSADQLVWHLNVLRREPGRPQTVGGGIPLASIFLQNANTETSGWFFQVAGLRTLQSGQGGQRRPMPKQQNLL